MALDTPINRLAIISFTQPWSPTMPRITGYAPDLGQADRQQLLFMPRVPLALQPIEQIPDIVCLNRGLDREDAVSRALDRQDDASRGLAREAQTSRPLRETCDG